MHKSMGYELIQELNKRAVPCLLENGATSMLWAAPEIKTLMVGACSITGDYCLHGARYRKRTRFATWNCKKDVVKGSKLNMRCSSKKGICDRTGAKHEELSGKATGNRQWKTAAKKAQGRRKEGGCKEGARRSGC